MQLFPTNAPNETCLLGIDLGRARCGLATANSSTNIALPLAVIETEPLDRLSTRVESSLDHRIPVLLVAGLPLDEHGREGESALWARGLAVKLAEELGVPVEFIDERFTTKEAYAVRKHAGLKARRNRKSIDAAAATVILQAYIDRHGFSSG